MRTNWWFWLKSELFTHHCLYKRTGQRECDITLRKGLTSSSNKFKSIHRHFFARLWFLGTSGYSLFGSWGGRNRSVHFSYTWYRHEESSLTEISVIKFGIMCYTNTVNRGVSSQRSHKHSPSSGRGDAPTHCRWSARCPGSIPRGPPCRKQQSFRGTSSIAQQMVTAFHFY